jgi:hypothetical protein
MKTMAIESEREIERVSEKWKFAEGKNNRIRNEIALKRK